MKRILSVLILFVLLCPQVWATEEMPAAETGRLRVLTSFYPVYIMALNVIKDVPGVSVENLTSGVTGCAHDYSLTVGDMKKISSSHIFITSGAGMESFTDKVAGRYPGLKIVALAEGITLIRTEAGRDNPHVWVSVSNAITEVDNLANAMASLDPAHALQYRKNGDDYISKLEALRLKMSLELAGYAGSKIVTFHEAFPYFAREFGLEIVGAVAREPGSVSSPKELAAVVEMAKRSSAKAIFSEPQYPATEAQIISRETGIKVYLLDPAVTGPNEPDAYIRIMENNLKTLKEALQ